jgi:hypothetical protein
MAETITSEVVGKVALPAGGGAAGAEAPVKGYQAISSKPFVQSDPKIQVRGGRGASMEAAWGLWSGFVCCGGSGAALPALRHARPRPGSLRCCFQPACAASCAG